MSDRLRFILDGEVKKVAGVDSNTSVLTYLRETLHRTGTKEGCAEGDCGACTVVTGELDGDRVRFRAINSCIQLLPTLDGKQLFTVESLKATDGDGDHGLHPAQQAMVDCHGSQCGFCTPGFVMSLFAMFRSEPEPSQARIHDVLAGNLCRCTGYRPIVEAAKKMYCNGHGNGDSHWLHRPWSAGDGAEVSPGEREMIEQLRAIQRGGTLSVTGDSEDGQSRRSYFAPTTLDDCAQLVLRHPDATLLAGGTDVGLWITKHHRDLDTIIYLGDVPELRVLDSGDTHLEIGAAVTITDAHELIAEHFPDLGELYRRFGSPPIRNAATLGGNIANGSPIGDSMPGLIALGASLVLRRGAETRELPLEELYIAYGQTALAPGEMVERVRIPLPAPDGEFRTYKVSKRFDQDISTVCAAYAFRLDGDTLRDVRICHGGMAATPKRAPECEQALEGKEWTESTLARGQEALDRDYAPITDMRASARYRRLTTRNLLHKLFLETSTPNEATRILASGR